MVAAFLPDTGPSRRRKALVAGATLVVLLIAVALLSLAWTPALPAKMQIAHKLQPPLAFGLLGTDQFGRDVLSMLMVGCWNSLSIAIVSVAIGGTLGSIIGITSAALRGAFEFVTMRVCDVVFALPPILSAMLLGAFLGPGRLTAILAIATFMIPVFARVSMASALQAWSRDYVLAAHALGNTRLSISLRHVLPNIASQIIVQVTIQLGLAILTEAGLSFLGLGLSPPAPTWGRMLADAQTYLALAPWLAILPGLAIALSVVGFNMLGDGLRDLLDPRNASR
ncbi:MULTISPECIES: ABC transporter permease [Rhizobium]|uniref:ABC transporter permease n=1 Tax=Rhizobium rhododendri TaxID=2506430 RepID=A0ABY8IQC8_9HYPH|nr:MULTISPECIES: ABC transporter permease [Rhizobium]MBO9101490.1 ABC transporter permease [Rhizobium sp. L58/93]MBO9134849.1 ABC transporter permease [Rhizobium sp. B209b/85]MBO9171178.1 ABC transporter permease [Rhizobium sp. L245/93]MBZ5763192.1 ABC transporter permease [Rhizobium sp. VS19-DR96]MBZ5769359.1 ABC transporter permease [Rhizobium sp. VS19-DR129.2]